VKWILRYIKDSIDVGLIFKKNVIGKQECTDTLILITQETQQTSVYNKICVYIIPSTGQLALYYTVYYRIVYYGG